MAETETDSTEEAAENWQWGDPCPDCGAEKFAYSEERTTEVFATPNGDVEMGDVYHVDDTDLQCAECWRPLPVDAMPS